MRDKFRCYTNFAFRLYNQQKRTVVQAARDLKECFLSMFFHICYFFVMRREIVTSHNNLLYEQINEDIMTHERSSSIML